MAYWCHRHIPLRVYGAMSAPGPESASYGGERRVDAGAVAVKPGDGCKDCTEIRREEEREARRENSRMRKAKVGWPWVR